MTTTDDVRPGDAAARVLELHRHYVEPHDSEPMERHYCEHCGENWPCDASALAAEVVELRANISLTPGQMRRIRGAVVMARLWTPSEQLQCEYQDLAAEIDAIVAVHDARLARGEDAG